MKITMPEIRKNATLKIIRSLSERLKDMTLEIRVIAEVEVNDRKVIISSESTVYNLLNKSVDEIRTEINGTLNGLIQYVKEKATKFVNVLLAVKETCESNNMEFDIVVD